MDEVKGNILKTYELGQSIWFDYISKDLLTCGGLKKLIEQGVKGVTSNPAIFKKAIAEDDCYDSRITELSIKGFSPEEIYEDLAIKDVRDAADVMKSVYDSTDRNDGYVSLEVSPYLAHDTKGTIEEALRLREALDRPNVMIKIPATDEGYNAIEEATARGININATLIFSMAHYESVAEAYISGLERLMKEGADISGIRSVASVFVSRIDTAVDKLLSGEAREELAGKVAIDNARLIYRKWEELFSSPRWDVLAAKGASPQRVLWASTGTKNDSYRDVLYVEELIGRDTVNTVPPKTLEKFLDHGKTEIRLENDLEGAVIRSRKLKEMAAVDLLEVCDFLREAGVQSFIDAFDILIESIKRKG